MLPIPRSKTSDRGIAQLPLDAGVAAPDAPNLIFICRLSIVGQMGSGKSTGCPAELDPFFRFPSAQQSVKETTDKTVAAADTVQHSYITRLHNLPFSVDIGNRTPQVVIGADHLTKRGGKSIRVGISGLNAFDHFFEIFDFSGNIFAAGFRAFDFQAKLEVLFIANKNICQTGDFSKNSTEFFFAAHPEGSAIVEIKRNPGAVLLGCAISRQN